MHFLISVRETPYGRVSPCRKLTTGAAILESLYDGLHLRLRVCDEGKCVNPEFFNNQGRSGHWGLKGIRERAKLVGGRLKI